MSIKAHLYNVWGRNLLYEHPYAIQEQQENGSETGYWCPCCRSKFTFQWTGPEMPVVVRGCINLRERLRPSNMNVRIEHAACDEFVMLRDRFIKLDDDRALNPSNKWYRNQARTKVGSFLLCLSRLEEESGQGIAVLHASIKTTNPRSTGFCVQWCNDDTNVERQPSLVECKDRWRFENLPAFIKTRGDIVGDWWAAYEFSAPPVEDDEEIPF